MRKLFGIHSWTTKKGEAGRNLVKVVVEKGRIRNIYNPIPSKDIKHTTFLIFGKCFTIDWNKEG